LYIGNHLLGEFLTVSAVIHSWPSTSQYLYLLTEVIGLTGIVLNENNIWLRWAAGLPWATALKQSTKIYKEL